MGYITTLTIIFLLSLSLLGYLSTIRFALDNGTTTLLLSSAATYSTSTHLPPRLHTSNPLLDDTLFPCLLTLTQTITSGAPPDLSLVSLYLFGQSIAFWILILLETFRIGNTPRSTLSSIAKFAFTACVGLASELFGSACALPLYFALHLLTSPTVAPPDTSSSKKNSRASYRANLLIPTIDLRLLPWSILFGLVIPTTLSLTLPLHNTSHATEHDWWKTRQFWALVRFAHPLLTLTLHFALRLITYPFSSPSTTKPTTPTIYTHLTYLLTPLHLLPLSPLLLASTSPSLFTRDALHLLDFDTLFSAPEFWNAALRRRPFDLAEGLLWARQWEVAVVVVAGVAWASALVRGTGGAGRKGVLRYLGGVTREVLVFVVSGPGGVAVELLRERDERVFLEGMGEGLVLGKEEEDAERKKEVRRLKGR